MSATWRALDEQHRGDALDAQEGPSQVHGEHPVEALDGLLLQGADVVDRGVVHQDVEVAELPAGEVDGSRPVALARDVVPDPPGGIAEVIGDGGDVILPEIGEHHPRTLGREQPVLRLALPERRTRDDGDLAGKPLTPGSAGSAG